MYGNQQPLFVLAPEAERLHGNQTQIDSIDAANAVSSIIKTTLGPNSMLKLMLDPMGGTVITNDGNAILREIDVTHPAAKALIELSRTQDDEVGDGTTSVVLLASSILSSTKKYLVEKIHPTYLVQGYYLALSEILSYLDSIATKLDTNDSNVMLSILKASLQTKFSEQWSNKISTLALRACKLILVELSNTKKEIDIKRYIRIEKIVGGLLEDSQVIDGLVMEKDVTHSRMARKIVDPKILLLDCPLEYKKGESMTNIEISNADDFEKILEQEEKEIKKMTQFIIKSGANLVITEKGVSDLAAHYLMKANVTVIRRAKKTEQNRLVKITGAKIINRCEEITQASLGIKCHLFEVKKIDDSYWTFLTKCEDPQACSVILRGGSKDTLNEVERNLHDALCVARCLFLDPRIVAGGGATEIELSCHLDRLASKYSDSTTWGIQAIAKALQIIPLILLQNSGGPVYTGLSKLITLHQEGSNNKNFGVCGFTGDIVNTYEKQIYDTVTSKIQIIKSAVECCAMIIRVDDILSGLSAQNKDKNSGISDLAV
uniref:T-complex protein 1 subunit gamma n=1 Tax=Dermatophagoides pteronyssinus TaxID=6956 RepID=A0A6P6YBY7_DERPT|nr:T-complex protein 1 subunit gamma-like [Dermatophagoides pteronyssinus]